MTVSPRYHPTIGRISEVKRFRVPLLRVEAEFEIRSIEECAFGGFGNREQGADLETIQRRAVVLREAVERHIESHLEPLGYAVRPFRHAYVCMV